MYSITPVHYEAQQTAEAMNKQTQSHAPSMPFARTWKICTSIEWLTLSTVSIKVRENTTHLLWQGKN